MHVLVLVFAGLLVAGVLISGVLISELAELALFSVRSSDGMKVASATCVGHGGCRDRPCSSGCRSPSP